MNISFSKRLAGAVIASAILSTSLWAGSDHIKHAVASDRPADEIGRDAGRRPAEVLDFAGIKPGMTIYEAGASTGYYTTLLSRSVGDDGKIIAQISPRFWERVKAVAEPKHQALGNVDLLLGGMGDYTGGPESLDMVFLSLLYHHFHFNGESGEALPPGSKDAFELAYSLLKPGGTIVVIEHEALPDTPRETSAGLHRATLQNAIDDFTSVGFEFAGSSDILANPGDPKDIPFRDLESGRDTSQRFVAKFRKPTHTASTN